MRTLISITVRFSVLLFVLFMFCGSSQAASKKIDTKAWVGKTFFLGHNIWFEKPTNILTTNYHKGAMLQVGSQAKITKVKRNHVVFTTKEGKFRLVYARKHHASVKMKDVLKRTFLKQNPLKSKKYKSFSRRDKKSIGNGEIRIGMRKDAVIMAYGYPPDHKTPSTKSSMWTYWINRFKTTSLKFNGRGKLKDIK